MKTTVKTTIDMLTETSVSIETKTFIEFEGAEREVRNNRKAYVNTEEGRKELKSEQPEDVAKAVLTVWGDTPVISDVVNE